MALAIKGWAHKRLENRFEQIAAYDDLVGRFLGDDAPILRHATCAALAEKVQALGEAGLFEDALETFSDLTDRFGEDDLAEVRAGVAEALVSKGWVCARMGKNKEAITAYDQVLSRYGSEGHGLLEGRSNGLDRKGRSCGSSRRCGVSPRHFDSLR